MAAQDAELKLKVSLDTAFFKQQLNGLASAAAGVPVSLQIKFDRRAVQKELRNLRQAIGRSPYRIEIGGNLDKLPKKIEDLREGLQKLKQEKVELDVGAKVGSVTQKEARKIRADLRTGILSRGGKILVPATITPAITNADVSAFKKAVTEKLSGITVKVKAELESASVAGGAKSPEQIKADVAKGLEEIARMGAERMSGGGVTEAARREQLRTAISGVGITEAKRIAKELGVRGAGKYRASNVSQLIDKIVADASIEAVKRYLDPQAMMRNPDRSGLNKVLDTFARGLFQMLGMDPAALKAAKAQTIQSATQTMQVARSSSGGLPAGVAGLLPRVTQRTAISQGVQGIYRGLSGQIREEGPSGALVDVRRIYAALERNLRKIFEVVEVDVQETSMGIKDAMGAFVYLAQALQDAEARTKKAQIGNAVTSLLEKVAGALKAAEARAVIPVSVVDVTRGATSPITGGPQRALPPAGGTTPPSQMRFNAVISAGGSGGGRGGGYVPPGGFPSDGPMGNKQGPATFIGAGSFMEKFKTGLDVASASMKNFRASQLPLVGGLKELTSEFGYAIKQVLLFGTAYKGLAFIQSLPGQILNAAKSQQQYNNALQTATQDTGTFAKELLYVDNVQRAFGLNLQTTRDGFTKLYASMAPTDFDSGSIEKLFTGISAATAALQLTPDKAERVIYAFGQMASKGQIMSEELKGQLGDVLPGALAIFAKSAGMSVKEFSKAMEDGEFVGQKFRDTFAKVSDELMTRFGTGAQLAGKSLQGLLNTVQGDFARTLESFAPLADAAAQAILSPLGGSLKQLSQAAKISTGEIERTYMQLKQAAEDVGELRAGGADAKEIKAAEQNVAALTARYKALMQAARDPAIAKQAQDIQKFTEELTKAGTFVMNMAKAIGNVLSPVLNLLGGNLTTVISLLTSFYVGFQAARLAAMALMGALSLYKGLTALLGFGSAASQATALAGAFNVLGVAATGAQVKLVGLRLALVALTATTLIGAVVGGITLIAGAFATMRDRANEAAQSSRDAAKAAVDAASTGNVAMAQAQVQTILAQSRADKKALETLKKLRARATPLQREGGFGMPLSPQESAALMGSELTKGLVEKGSIKQGRRNVALPTSPQMQDLERKFGVVAQEQKVALDEAKAAAIQAQKTAKDIGLNLPTPGVTEKTETQTEETKKGKELDTYIADATKLFAQQKENLLLGIEEEMLLGKISETEAKRKTLLIEKLYEEKAVREALRLAQIKANEANLSAADKELKKADLKKQSDLELANIAKKYGVEILKVQLGLEEPIKDAIANTTAEMDKQAMMLEQVGGGFTDLSYDQKAYLDALALTKDYSEADKLALQDKILELRRLREEYYKNDEVLKKRLTLLEAQKDLESIGTGLMSGYIGSAASRFESALVESDGDVDYATKLADIETRAMQLRSVFEGIQGAIEGVSGAFANVLTEGIAAMVTGTATAKEVFASFLQSVAQALSQAAAQMIATYIAIGIAKAFAGLNGKGLDVSGFKQYPILEGPGFTPGAANGAYFDGPTAFFANGGIVSSPTFFQFADGGKLNAGIMGEAGPEAIIPLKRGPDGKLGVSLYNDSRRAVANAENNAGISSIDYEDPLSTGGASASRQSLSSKAAQAVMETRMQVMEQRSYSEKRSEMRQIEEMVARPAKIDVEYQSQVINNVEYVTREQAERMASQSALRGRELAIGALQNSVKARKRAGMA